MTIFDQLIIGKIASHDDFGASVKERETPPPKKKTIKETLPFSNATYDFSSINGETYWEERELSYVFEIIATTPEELEEKKTAFANWVMNVANEEIHDPYIDGYHFLGTFDSMDYDDEESADKSTITVNFTAYPYKIANDEKNCVVAVSSGSTVTLSLVNNSGHRVQLAVTTDTPIKFMLGDTAYSVPVGTVADSSLMLPVGSNSVIVQNESARAATVSFAFREEVF